jgi:hypothetical protein
MKFSMTEQEKSDLLIQVTAWVSLTVYYDITLQNHKHGRVPSTD